ncbi:MAG: type I-D CRISPR-associated helicase Cas3', partial [Halobacteria archaeon]
MIHLDGVAVPRVDAEYLDFQPYDHQFEAEKLIKSKDEFFAVNTSPTGSGKTYSWLKPALDEKIDTIAVFPTNSLIADQHETTRELLEDHYPEANVIELTGETASKWRAETRGRRDKGEAIRLKLDESLNKNSVTVVLTNPDIFTLIRKNMYRHTNVFGLPNRFGMLIFDEFHLADVRQRDILLFLIDEINELPDKRSRANRFYFLSATPDESDIYRSLEERIRYAIGEEVDSIRAKSVPLSSSGEGYRGVMPEVNLELRETQTFRTKDKLLSEDVFEEFVEFCAGGQTVVMLDGV